MSNNPAAAADHHIINIPTAPTSDRLRRLHKRMSQPPKLLKPTAGHTSCCIFRAPPTFVELNGKSYQPHVVSIGPYHHGEPQLAMIEEHKWRYLGSMLARIEPRVGLQSLLDSVSVLESDIRACYSEAIEMESDEFVELMVVDGCFLIELFRKVAGIVPFEDHDPILSMSWVMANLCRDFIGLENQIPFFVLEALFRLTHSQTKEGNANTPPSQSQSQSFGVVNITTLALNFFNNLSMLRPIEIIEKYKDLESKHLLDLIRSSYTQFEVPSPRNRPTHIIQCISRLHMAGIKLKRVESASLLEVKFQRGVLEMPTMTIDEFMSSFLVNVVAYEQCHVGCHVKHFTTYAALLDSLVKSSNDVEYLSDMNIFENYLGTDDDVAGFLNNLGKEVAFDIDTCYLATVFNDVHLYYMNSWHVQWSAFKFTYFKAAFLLLVLTVLQTFFTIYGSF
ncbi:UPF0481 protein At3g47200 [Linum perenne]